MIDKVDSQPMIEAIGLSKFYGPFAACRDVSFDVHEGELVAFLGPNGAGKSTTMKLLTGYVAPSEGVAKIAGHNMAIDRIAGSERLGYLPENGPLYPDMTPHSQLEFFADAGACPASGGRHASKRSSSCACWAACFTSRSPSCPRAFGSVWAWPNRCCTSRTC